MVTVDKHPAADTCTRINIMVVKEMNHSASMNRMIASLGHQVAKLIPMLYARILLAFLAAIASSAAIAAPPAAPTGLCIDSTSGTLCAAPSAPTGQTGVFPGTNLKFRPGFVIAAQENESPSVTESRWQALFTASPNRKVSYRPTGIYGGVVRRLKWYRFYTDQNVRPANPSDPTDPAYNWAPLDAIFTINAVKNEGALVMIGIMEVGYGGVPLMPQWLVNAPYNGLFIDTAGNRAIPAYYRYSGPDARGFTNVNLDKGPPIVDEFVAFQQAMHDHLVATGNIDKVMGVQTSEFYGGGASGYETDFYHGVGTRAKLLNGIWEKSQIPVYQSSVSGGSTMSQILAQYVNTTQFGLNFPDMKLVDTGNPALTRFSVDGIYQKDLRPIMQSTEPNGVRNYTYFSPDVPNPWGYSNETYAQTASHIIWALSGSPKGVNKDSGLGQAGDDPPGIMPVHTVILDWGSTGEPTIDDWHTAIDTFGPPGTFAFPYLPPGYNP